MSGSGAFRSRAVLAVTLAAIAWGAYQAYRLRFLSDDAFVVFRYAENLARGAGLVFNIEETVEGYTDFLWVLWCALAVLLGIPPETWALATGIACYVATLGLLAAAGSWLSSRLPDRPLAVPAAAVLGAFHQDWQVWATSGLETSAYTALLVLASLLLLTGPLTARRLAASGLLFGAAALTRYDGIVPAVIAGLFVLQAVRRTPRRALPFALAFLAVLLPFLVFRAVTYGELLPNTYHARSAGLAWYRQGLTYVALYARMYWPLLAALLLLPAALQRHRGNAAFRAQAGFALAMSIGFTLAIARVGGDFMFARMLIPVTPFYLLLVELSLDGLPSRSGAVSRAALTAVLALLLATAPRPVPPFEQASPSGITDERSFYAQPGYAAFLDQRGATLRRFFEGLPVRILVFGTEVRMAYRSGAPYVLEAHGLTDRWIARLPVAARGRPGHEKLVTLDYAVGTRKVHFGFQPDWLRRIGLGDRLPVVIAELGDVKAYVLRWDPPLLAALARRGARVPDFPASLDRLVGNLDRLSDAHVRKELAGLRLFYFDHVDDPVRLAAFERRLRQGRSDAASTSDSGVPMSQKTPSPSQP